MDDYRFLFEGRPGDPLIVLRSRFWDFNAIGFYHGEHAAVIDPGIYPDEIRALEEALCTRDVPTAEARREVSDVLLTHSHHDHIRGWKHFEKARVTAPQVVADKDARARSRILARKSQIDAKLGIEDEDFTYPEPEVVFDDTTRLRIGGLDAELRFLPGHSDCTSIVYLPQLSTLCTADYLVSPGLPYCRWQARAFERAIEILRGWVQEDGIERVIPAHNDPLIGSESILAALDEEAHYFRDLRAFVRAHRDRGDECGECIQQAGAYMKARRGQDLGGRERQDLDNARRVLAEEWPEREEAPQPALRRS